MRAINRDVQALRDTGLPMLDAVSPEQARRAYAEARRANRLALDDLPAVWDEAAPGLDGPVPLRVFNGAGDTASPCLMFMHGGGWMLGDLETHAAICRRIARLARCRVIAVDYRLAPEHPFPAAVEDCLAAVRWIVANAAVLGVDPDRLAVGGDSAGGNLAAALALMGRDGQGPRVAYQVLLYPCVDLRMTGESYDTVADGMPLTPAAMRIFADGYVPVAADRDDWRASPLRAASLAGTPPAFVLTCGHDPLCSEGRLYAERLEREGVAVTALHMSDQAHGILTLGRVIGAVDGLLGFVATSMREVWRKRPPDRDQILDHVEYAN